VLQLYGSGSTYRYSIGGTAPAPPIRVFTGNPMLPGATEILIPGIILNTETGVMYQNVVGAPSPRSTLQVQVMAPTDSFIVPVTIPAGGEIWIQAHLRYGLRGDRSGAYFAPNARFVFNRGYLLKTRHTVDAQPLSNPEVLGAVATGSDVIGVAGFATDLNGRAKGGLWAKAYDPSSNLLGQAQTALDSGAYLIPLPVGAKGTVVLYNAMGTPVASNSFGGGSGLASGQVQAVEFPDLSPADPVIMGIVGTSDGPIAGALVELIRTNGKVASYQYTEASGLYNFRFAQPGTYTVRVIAPGAAPVSQTVTVQMFEERKLDFSIRR
jgi:hypothetical protein